MKWLKTMSAKAVKTRGAGSKMPKDWFDRQEKGGFYAALIWSLAALSFGYAFFHRVAPSVMVSDLMTEFAIGGAMLGMLSALYFYPYVLLQIPLGALLETVGARLLLTLALSCAGAGSIIFGLAESLYIAYLGRVLIGVGCGVGFLGSLALASRWFPPSRFGLLAGLTMFIGMGSGMLAQGPLALFVESYGWRTSLFMLGATGFILATAIFVLVRNAPFGSADEKAKKADRLPLLQVLKQAAQTIEVWKISLVAATMSGPMLVLGGLWGTPYMMAAYDLARPEAAFLVSLLLLGWAVGAPFGGWLSDRIGKRRPILICGSALVCLSLAVLIFVPDLALSLSVALFVLIGLAGGFMACCFALVREVIPAQIIGGATGIVNSLTVASGAVLQPLVGLMLDLQWRGNLQGELQGNAPVYNASDYRTAFILVLVSAALGLIMCLRLKETKKSVF
jgi:MFS family permease